MEVLSINNDITLNSVKNLHIDESFKIMYKYESENNKVIMHIRKCYTFLDKLIILLDNSFIQYDIINDDKIDFTTTNKDTLILSISLIASNFLDLFGKLNDKYNNIYYPNDEKYKIYELLKAMNDFYLSNRLHILPKITFSIFNKDLSNQTIIPFKLKGSDVGFDITLIREIKRDGNIIMYGSNISVEVPLGYYTELVPRSSIYKSGYFQVNSVGVIDPSYTGELCTVLCKINLEKPDIELPFRYGQLILKKYELAITEVKEELNKTSRGIDGFGSTG